MNNMHIERSYENLVEQLQEQHNFFKKSCQVYDN